MLSNSQLQHYIGHGGFVLEDHAHRGADYTSVCGETLFELADGFIGFVQLYDLDEEPIIVLHENTVFDDKCRVGIRASITEAGRPLIHIYLAKKTPLEHARLCISDICATAASRGSDMLNRADKTKLSRINNRAATTLGNRLLSSSPLATKFNYMYSRRLAT